MSDKQAIIAVGDRGIALESLDSLWRWAQYVAASGLAPKGMERPETVLVATEMGLELGLKPMTAIQSIAVINGRPGVWGDTAKALVLAHPACEQFEEFWEGKPYEDAFTAICIIRRAGHNRPVRWEYSVADAKKAGIWGKQGPWSTAPRRMLQMRARSFAMRDAFPDVLRGLDLAETVRDYDAIDVTPAEPVQDPPAKPRTLDDLEAISKAPAPPKGRKRSKSAQETSEDDTQCDDTTEGTNVQPEANTTPSAASEAVENPEEAQEDTEQAVSDSDTPDSEPFELFDDGTLSEHEQMLVKIRELQSTLKWSKKRLFSTAGVETLEDLSPKAAEMVLTIMAQEAAKD